MTISAVRHASLLNGQSAIARKVYELVPIQEAWDSNRINAALSRTTRAALDFRILQGCLVALKGAGLIYEPQNGLFQRSAIRQKTMALLRDPNKQPESKGYKPASLELLQELSERARKLASDIEAAAAVIAEEAEENAESLRKLAQLQALLKSLA